MRTLKPSVKAAIASTLVLTSAAAIAYAVPKVTSGKSTSTGNELKLEVERIDSDTVKVAIDNIQDIPKALQFSIKLDGVKLQDGEKSIKDLVEKEVQTRLKNKEYSTNTNSILTDYTYNEKDNTIDVLITSENSLPKTENKVEVFELDVKAASGDIQSYKVLPNDENKYKYISNTNKEYNNLGVTHDNEAISLNTAPTITVDDSYIMVVEGETLELTAKNLKEKIGLEMSHEDGDDNLTLEVQRDGKVIESFTEDTVGIYELELRAVKNGTIKSEAIKLTVNVALDNITEPPTITKNGKELEDITIEAGSVFKPLENVKAVDNKGREVEVDVKADKDLDLDPEKDTTYILTYIATDIYGNTTTKKVELNVKANKAPVISGVKDHVLKVGDKFDPTNGVTVTDEDKDIKLNVDSNVNTSIAGEYKVLYSATDSKGKTTRVQSKVTVNPKAGTINKAPVITAEDKTIKVGDKFDPKSDIKATDAEDGDITSKIEVVQNNVDTSKEGTYTVKYSVTDSKGSTATKTIKVTVNPKAGTINKVPVITAEDKTIKVGDKFDPKSDIKATDAEDGDITSKIEVVQNNVDTSKEGTYTVKYSVTDSKGATATKTIKVTVKKDIVLAENININDKNNNKIYVGGSKNITASVNKEADIKDIDWKISDESIAELSIDGNEATIVAKTEGEITLTASTTDGSNLSDTMTINITNFNDDSELPSYIKDVIDTNVLTPISGLGIKEYPLEFEMKNITIDELDSFLEGLKEVENKLISISEDEEFTIYELKLTKKSGLLRFINFINSEEDSYIKIKVSKDLDNSDEINRKLAQLADDETDDGNDNSGSTDDGNDNSGSTDDGNDNSGSTDDGNDNSGSTDDGNDNSGSTDDGNDNSESTDDTPKTGDASILGYVGIASVAVGGLFLNKKRKKIK